MYFCREVSENFNTFRWKKSIFIIPNHTIVSGYYGITLALSVSVRRSILRTSICLYFHFWTITWVNISGFSPNLVCALMPLILCRYGLGLLIGKFPRFLTELSAWDMSIFLFPDDNFSKYLWIFARLSIYIDIVKIWLGIANGQISSILTVICLGHDNGRVLLFQIFFF